MYYWQQWCASDANTVGRATQVPIQRPTTTGCPTIRGSGDSTVLATEKVRGQSKDCLHRHCGLRMQRHIRGSRVIPDRGLPPYMGCGGYTHTPTTL